MRRSIACIVLALATAQVASADDKVLVLRAEGRADKKIRTKVEAAVLKLAQSTGEPTTAGDVTFGDAAMMVGCKPDEGKCNDEVLGMLSVDEIVAITATPKPGGIEVAVRRIGKGGTARNAATLVTADKADQLDALAPLFGASGPASPLPPAVTTTPPTPVREPVPAPVVVPPPATTTPEPPPSTIPPPTTTATVAPLPGPVEEPRDQGPSGGGNRRLAMFGMAGGGALLVVGIVFWASAKNIEAEIADAPMRTRDDLERIQDLEAEGDGYATAGNVLAVSGLILGGVSTYFFLKSGKRRSHTATVAPIVGNGTGIAITWGGSL